MASAHDISTGILTSSSRNSAGAAVMLTWTRDEEIVPSQFRFTSRCTSHKDIHKTVHWDTDVVDNEKQAGEISYQQRLMRKKDRIFTELKRAHILPSAGRASGYQVPEKQNTKKTNLLCYGNTPNEEDMSMKRHRRHVRDSSTILDRGPIVWHSPRPRHENTVQSGSHARSRPPPAPRPPRLPTPELPPISGKAFCSCCDGNYSNHDFKDSISNEHSARAPESCDCPDSHWGEHLVSCPRRTDATIKMNHQCMRSFLL